MPQASFRARWNFLLHGDLDGNGNDAKSLPDAKSLRGKTSSKPSTEAADAAIKLEWEQRANEKLSVSIAASARVSSIAARGIQDVIKAQAGASTTSTSALHYAKEFSEFTTIPIRIVADVENKARDRPSIISYMTPAADLERIATRISRWAQKEDNFFRDKVDRLNRAEGEFARKGPRYRATTVAACTALAEAIRTIAQIVEAHVAVITQSKKPVPSIETLLICIQIATSQAAFAAAEAVTVRDAERPPPYEE